MSAYQALIDVLTDVAEQPETAALEVLEALKEMPAEMAEAGVEPSQWRKASDAMIAIARAAYETRRAADAEVRQAEWPATKARLEQSGCQVAKGQGEVWRITGTGLSIDVDLSTGAAEHSDGELGENLPEFERLEDYIIRSITSREAHNADLARRKERQKTHRWDNSKKVWLPKNAIGPVIRAGA